MSPIASSVICANSLGQDFRHLTFDCDHMVAETKPAEVAALIRERMA